MQEPLIGLVNKLFEKKSSLKSSMLIFQARALDCYD